MPSASPQPAEALRCLIIVPAFNESHSVGRLVVRLKRSLPTYDVLVIDDGSTDDTAAQVPRSAATVLSMPFNLGIGGAMQAGYRYAALHGYDVAIQCDGDGQHRPQEVQRLVQHMVASGSDLVLGSRFLENVKYRQSVFRMTGSFVLGYLIRLVTGMRVTDCTSGFRAVNGSVIRAFAHWYPEDYPEPEVILLLKRAGFRITEIPVRMRQRRGGNSSISLLQGMFYVLKVVVCVLLDLAREPWPRGSVTHVDSQPVSDRPGWKPAGARPPSTTPV